MKNTVAGEGTGSAAGMGSWGLASGASFFISFAVSLVSETFSFTFCALVSYF